jgi:hypothetical protein
MEPWLSPTMQARDPCCDNATCTGLRWLAPSRMATLRWPPLDIPPIKHTDLSRWSEGRVASRTPKRIEGQGHNRLCYLDLRLEGEEWWELENVFVVRDLSSAKEKCTIGSERAEETVDALGAEEGWSVGEEYLRTSQVVV